MVPIYGRGGDNTDPRTRTSAAEAAEAKNAEEPGPVPRRPAGQRPVPVQVPCADLMQSHAAVAGRSSWLPPLPTLAGLTSLPLPPQRTPFNAAGNMNMQPGLGIIPTLFGLQQGQGA